MIQRNKLKKASVFCIPSVVTEYYHLDEIKEFNIDLIEIPTIALLVVSDNSATGVALVGRKDEEQEKYDYTLCLLSKLHEAKHHENVKM